MNFKIIGLALLLAVAPLACTTSQQRIVYNSLASVGMTADASYKAYLDGVVHGTIVTNGVPSVSQAYATFQITYAAALAVAQFQTNAPATTAVADAAASLATSITKAKGGL